MHRTSLVRRETKLGKLRTSLVHHGTKLGKRWTSFVHRETKLLRAFPHWHGSRTLPSRATSKSAALT